MVPHLQEEEIDEDVEATAVADWDKVVADAVYGEHRTLAVEALLRYDEELAQQVREWGTGHRE